MAAAAEELLLLHTPLQQEHTRTQEFGPISTLKELFVDCSQSSSRDLFNLHDKESLMNLHNTCHHFPLLCQYFDSTISLQVLSFSFKAKQV